MKKLILLFFIINSGVLLAQTVAEPVYSITITQYPFEYYQKQAQAWAQEVQNEGSSAQDWFYYFTAARMQNMLAPDENTKRYDMDEIVQNISTKFPNSFEDYYVQFWKKNFTPEGIAFLKKAHAFAPDRYEAWTGLMTHAELERDTATIRQLSERILHHPLYSPGITHWNYNVLMSVEQNAILLTHGDNETYPIWLLQYVQGIRTDVSVVNASLIMVEDYRNSYFTELGLPSFEQTISDYDGNWEAFTEAIIKHILDYAEQPVYLGIAGLPQIREKYPDQFYLTGLAFRYSKNQIDHVAMMRNNFENRFLLDQLRVNLQPDFSSSVVKHMNQHYIPCLGVLYKHYKISGEISKAQQTAALLIDIAQKSGRMAEIQDYLTRYE